ncbi:hypothetical protein LCGC14_1121330 [marine sediment metagenome]|uniref:Uncharacterized protein n=1 Tax=marine sediment metagenome TaxID=412755 RepID=A0A0F9MRM8_9ZZZZ
MSWFITGIKNLVRIRPEPFDTGWLTVPLVTGAAYATGEAVGGQPFSTGAIPKKGTINTIMVMDEDKEELACDLAIFDRLITATADQAAFDVKPEDMLSQVGSILITNADYVTYANSSYATVPNVGYQYTAPEGLLLIQWVTRGVPNFATGKLLVVRFLGYSGHGGK